MTEKKFVSIIYGNDRDTGGGNKMLEFRSVEYSDIPIIRKYFDEFNEFSCEFSSINMLIWQEYFGFSFCIEDGVLYSKNYINGRTSFGIPFTRDMPKAISKLKEYAKENSLPLILFGGQGERLDILNSQMDGAFKTSPIRDAFEYVYNSEDLAYLRGKKYHSKRNHISTFKKRYNWSYEELTKENAPDVLKLLDHWYNSYTEKAAETMEIESKGINRILAGPEINGVMGGVLRVDGNIIAFTLGCEISKSVFDVNFEKALVEFDGAYAMINQQFVLNQLSSYKYINREDDMGIEGLRKAKLSYKPEILLEKYIITLENDNG